MWILFIAIEYSMRIALIIVHEELDILILIHNYK